MTNPKGLIAALSLAGLSSMTAFGSTPIPEGGESLLSENHLTQAGNFWGGNFEGSPVASAAVVDVDHPDFDQAMRVTVSNPAGQYWNGAIQLPSTEAVETNDVLFIRLYFRSIESKDESGVGFATVFPQGPMPEYKKFLTREVTATTEWKEYLFPFVVDEPLAAGELSLQIGAGAGSKTQIWEVGGIEFLNYKKTLELADLPITRPSYAGREDNAAWRAAAAERIERYRKGDFTIQVLDTNGEIAEDASVELTFVRHAYHFGSVIVANRIMSDSGDNLIYKEKFLDLFNQSGPENDTKWAPWAGEWGSSFAQSQTLEALEWLQENNIYARGHVLVWPSKRNLPNLMQGYLPEGNPAGADPTAKQVVLDHIDDATSKTRYLLDEWDVLNEPYDNFYLMDAFGDEIMVDWFKQARANLPRHGLYLNDYGILSAGGRDFAHQQHFEDTIEYLLSQDAPLTGIGMQGHFSSSPTAIELVYNILERYHQAFPQLDIRITEFDVSTEDEEMQADYTRDLLTIAFSHPATVGVQCWGFWENAHWRPTAAMFASDWREKPNATIWREMTQEVWWNDFAGETDSQGRYTNRGFFGDYELTVSHNGNSRTLPLNITADGPRRFVVQLDAEGDIEDDFKLSFASDTQIGPHATIESNGESILYLESSYDLNKWTPEYRHDNDLPNVQYQVPLNTDQPKFYRLVDENTDDSED